MADLSIAARQREKNESPNSLFAACGREGGRAQQDRVSFLRERTRINKHFFFSPINLFLVDDNGRRRL
jgi:hypothetical protein